MIVKKDFLIELSDEQKSVFEICKKSAKEKGLEVLISKEIIGKSQLGGDAYAWIMVVGKNGMVVRKEARETANELFGALTTLLSDYEYD